MVDLSAEQVRHRTNPNQPNPFSRQPQCWPLPMLTTTALLAWKLIAVFLVVIAILDLLTMSRERRIKLYHHQGLSQRSIADRFGISRYTVRKALAH